MHSSVLFLVSHTDLKPSDAFNYDKSLLVCFWEVSQIAPTTFAGYNGHFLLFLTLSI